MSAIINAQPEVLDLALYAGDGFRITLLCKNSAGIPVDMTGSVSAQIRTSPLATGAPIVTFSSNVTDAYQGIVILSLTGVQTRALMDDPSASPNNKFVGVWDLQWSPSGEQPRTLCKGKVECEPDVTR